MVLAGGRPEDEDGGREDHLLRSVPGFGLGNPGLLEGFLQADFFAKSLFDFRRLVRLCVHSRAELLLEVGAALVQSHAMNIGFAARAT